MVPPLLSSHMPFASPNLNFLGMCVFVQAVTSISDIPTDVPIHLELAGMTDPDLMRDIIHQVITMVESLLTFRRDGRCEMNLKYLGCGRQS